MKRYIRNSKLQGKSYRRMVLDFLSGMGYTNQPMFIDPGKESQIVKWSYSAEEQEEFKQAVWDKYGVEVYFTPKGHLVIPNNVLEYLFADSSQDTFVAVYNGDEFLGYVLSDSRLRLGHNYWYGIGSSTKLAKRFKDRDDAYYFIEQNQEVTLIVKDPRKTHPVIYVADDSMKDEKWRGEGKYYNILIPQSEIDLRMEIVPALE